MKKKSVDNNERFNQSSLRAASYGKLVHRDYAAHFFRWGFVTRFIRPETEVLDIGCGVDVPLVIILSKYPSMCNGYVGVDLNRIPRIPSRPWAEIHPEFDFLARHEELGRFDVAVCLEVVEHMQREDAVDLLRAARDHLNPGGIMLLSTPVYDEVHQAKNHVQEYTIAELTKMVQTAGWAVKRRFGTFASLPQLQRVLSPEHRRVFDELSEYYSNDVLSTFLAPLYPDTSRNNLWVLESV